MNVTDLNTRRRATRTPRGPRTELEALATRIEVSLNQHDALLVPRHLVEDALTDLRATTAAITIQPRPTTRSGDTDG